MSAEESVAKVRRPLQQPAAAGAQEEPTVCNLSNGRTNRRSTFRRFLSQHFFACLSLALLLTAILSSQVVMRG